MDLFGLKRRRYWKPLRELGLEPEELALVEADLQHGDQEAATAHMAAAQERARSLFKAQTGIDSRNILPLVGSEISWGEIVRHMFKIHDFDRAGTTIGPNDQVKASSLNHPYGYLLVDSPILDQKVSLPIIHRDDFILATTVFDEPGPTSCRGRTSRDVCTKARPADRTFGQFVACSALCHCPARDS